MQKQIAIGDPVLWYGFNLQVVAIHDNNGNPIAEVADTKGLAVRAAAIEELKTLRSEPADAHMPQTIARVKELDEMARHHMVRAKLRVDLLSWWGERAVWVSDGRILTDAQIEAFTEITGSRPKPDAQRKALLMLEYMGG